MAKKPGPAKAPQRARMTVTARANIIVEQLMGMGQEALTEALTPTHEVCEIDVATGLPKIDEDGSYVTKRIGSDPRVAMWLIDRAWPKKGSVLPKDMDVDVSTMSGVILCAQKATEMVLRRELAVGDASDLLDYLMKYAQLRAYERLDELKELVSTLEKETAVTAQIDGKLVPQWGKLNKDTKAANKIPAE